MRRVILVGAFLALGACSTSEAAVQAGSSPAAETSSTASQLVSTTATPLVTFTTTTTTTSTTTTTTTTQAPPLDRNDAATLVRMQEDLANLLDRGSRPAGSASEYAASLYLAERLKATGLDVTTVSVPLPTGETSQNVSLTIGSGVRRVLVGAHYDSFESSPGADDNGSGTVLLLELARRLAETPLPGAEVTIVLFGAEEILPGYSRNDHHHGSRQMADELAAAAALPDEMLSVDMVGFDNTILAAFYRDTDQAAAERLVAAGASAGFDIVLSGRGDISDHEAFARAGVPAVMMWRPSNPGYHSAADTEVNWDHMLDNLVIVEAWLALQP